MVSIDVLMHMKQHYEKNLPKYILKHKNEYLLLEEWEGGIKESFYTTSQELSRATARYKGLLGPTFITRKIPIKIKTLGEEVNEFFKKKLQSDKRALENLQDILLKY
jgi:hypothetical protein